MERRSFLTGTSILSTALYSNLYRITGFAQNQVHNFRLKYAPHLGMFKHHAGNDPIDQLNFMADQGFTAFEDNGMKDRDIGMQEKMASTMAKRGMEMGVFVAHKIYWKKPTLAKGDISSRDEFLSHIKESVEVAKRVYARWMTVVPGHMDLKQDMGYQTAHVIDTLRRACDILEPHDLTIVLEPLNFRNHPGLFLTKAAQAYEICKSVNSSSCKILFDIYHQQIQEGNIIPNIELCWKEISYFQIGDNPGRNEPTTGEINFINIFKYIHSLGYKGILGMEHGNKLEGKEGETALIQAYKTVDSF